MAGNEKRQLRALIADVPVGENKASEGALKDGKLDFENHANVLAEATMYTPDTIEQSGAVGRPATAAAGKPATVVEVWEHVLPCCCTNRQCGKLAGEDSRWMLYAGTMSRR